MQKKRNITYTNGINKNGVSLRNISKKYYFCHSTNFSHTARTEKDRERERVWNTHVASSQNEDDLF